MNESLFILVARIAIQASFLIQVQFEGLTFDWNRMQYVIRYWGREPLWVPTDFLFQSEGEMLRRLLQALPTLKTLKQETIN